MSRTKTVDQYTISNAVTARLLTVVKPTETLARDWAKTNERREMVTSTITLQTKHQIDWDSATCITYSRNCCQRLTLESWFTNLKQTPLNRSQQLPAPEKRLIDKIKQNYERRTGQLTIWLTIDGSKRTNYITSLHSQQHHGLTDRRSITSRRNWPVRSITRV